LVFDIEEGPYAEGIREHGAEENIWDEGNEVTIGLRKLNNEDIS
jgi:hypothetical protein